ncbi:hypothetical protein [Vespertiliibacter pulmonis]|nr:hypothetical protein [Vespertiliibacter pulmonis]
MSKKRERKITRTEYITISYDANDPKLKEHKLNQRTWASNHSYARTN